jgi:hypothetical protein
MSKRSHHMPKSPKSGKKNTSPSPRKTSPPSQAEKDELVLTPGGWRPKSKVHRLEPGHHVSGKGGRLRVIETATGKVIKDLGEVSKKKHSHANASGKSPKVDVPLPDVGWIENTGWSNTGSTPIAYFSTTWVVPPAPASDDKQVVFLFNGLEQNGNGATPLGPYILQPVLQWGPSEAGGGSYWSITNWYVNGLGGTALYKSLIRVNPGDVLQGIMTLTGQSGSKFNYLSSFVGYPNADLAVTDIDELTWACETLECYGPGNKSLTQCSDYPDTILTALYDIEIKVGNTVATSTDANINWQAATNFAGCGQKCLIVSKDSPGGDVYLYYKSITQTLYFIVDKSTFGKDEVADVLAANNGVFPNAFWLVLEGFTIDQLSIDQPSPVAPLLSGAFDSIPGVTITPNSSGPEYELPGDQYTPQRIRFPFDVQFTSDAFMTFPASDSIEKLLKGSITIAGNTLTAETLFELTAGEEPYFTNVDPSQNNVYWLSQDLRVFTAVPGINKTPVAGIGTPPQLNPSDPTALDTNAAYQYIQQLLNYLNTNYDDPNGTDPFNSLLPGQASALTGDSSVTPYSLNIFNPFGGLLTNYNFALARVRLRGTAGATADNVKAFFRLWVTQSADADYDPNSTYLSNLDFRNLPASPLPAPDSHTIPFFATGNSPNFSDPNDPEYRSNGVNNQKLKVAAGDGVWTYFGCFLNLYDSGNIVNGSPVQALLVGTHHCIVAQIAYDDAPIVNSNGVVMNPENSDKLAQRNLQITLSDNPGGLATHRIPQTFDVRPSPPIAQKTGDLLNYPDELMIDWGNTPAGATANIYWPQVDAAQVLQLASRFSNTQLLSAPDANTIKCTVGKCVTYVPIPAGSGQGFAGLFTVDLPPTVTTGQEFNIIVRRITTRRYQEIYVATKRSAAAMSNSVGVTNWRYVVGTFQIKIPVTTKEVILFPEENTLAILKWRLQSMSPTNRWYPVLQRYVSYIAARVDGLGGDSTTIAPSLQGVPAKGEGRRGDRIGYTGKVCGLVYDRFGDFEGFLLVTEAGEERCFRSRENEVRELVHRAWVERIVITVFVHPHELHCPASVVLRRAPKLFQH